MILYPREEPAGSAEGPFGPDNCGYTLAVLLLLATLAWVAFVMSTWFFCIHRKGKREHESLTREVDTAKTWAEYWRNRYSECQIQLNSYPASTKVKPSLPVSHDQPRTWPTPALPVEAVEVPTVHDSGLWQDFDERFVLGSDTSNAGDSDVESVYNLAPQNIGVVVKPDVVTQTRGGIASAGPSIPPADTAERSGDDSPPPSAGSATPLSAARAPWGCNQETSSKWDGGDEDDGELDELYELYARDEPIESRIEAEPTQAAKAANASSESIVSERNTPQLETRSQLLGTSAARMSSPTLGADTLNQPNGTKDLDAEGNEGPERSESLTRSAPPPPPPSVSTVSDVQSELLAVSQNNENGL